jgi:hypothetical protein
MTPEEIGKMKFIDEVLAKHKETDDWFQAFTQVAQKFFDESRV